MTIIDTTQTVDNINITITETLLIKISPQLSTDTFMVLLGIFVLILVS